jgi:hypothetical protein
MFDDKIGDVYKGGRKIGELRRPDDGCTGGLLVGLFLVVAVIAGLTYGAYTLIGAIPNITGNIYNQNKYGTTDPTVVASAVAGGNIYEAEDPGNTLEGGAYVEKCPQCSGGLVVFNLGVAPNVDPGALQFNNVHVAKNGTYPMVISYCDYYTTNNTGYISVNGGEGITVSYPSVGSCLVQNTTIGSLTILIDLHRGNNTIKFYNHDAGTSYIDRIVIQPTSGK